jgi:hypothetical protein
MTIIHPGGAIIAGSFGIQIDKDTLHNKGLL